MFINKETKQVFSSLSQIRHLYPTISIGEKADLSFLGIYKIESSVAPTITENQFLVKGEPEEYEPNKFRETWIISTTINNEEDYIPESVTPLQGLLAIEQYGLTELYEQWSNDPSRTFKEKAFIHKAQSWKFDDPIIDSAIKSFNLTEEDKINLFKLAATK